MNKTTHEATYCTYRCVHCTYQLHCRPLSMLGMLYIPLSTMYTPLNSPYIPLITLDILLLTLGTVSCLQALSAGRAESTSIWWVRVDALIYRHVGLVFQLYHECRRVAIPLDIFDLTFQQYRGAQLKTLLRKWWPRTNHATLHAGMAIS